MRKPFYIQKLDAWFCWINGKQERLTDRGGTEKDAFNKFGELAQAPTKIRPSTSVIWLLDEYLDWAKVNLAETTYNWYRHFLTSFCKSNSAKDLTISEIRPHHVLKWADGTFGDDSPSTRHGAIRSVQRAFTWATDTGIITVNPVARIQKPTPNRREQLISPDMWEEILQKEPHPDWKDFLIFMRETGCRVQETRLVELKHYDAAHTRFVLPPSKAKGKKVPRIIYCTEIAVEIVLRRIKEYPTGPIFRNTRKNPVTRNAIRCRFSRYGGGLCATLLRHTYITEALIKGVDCVSVAALCGHDPATLAKTYQKVSQNPQYLGDLARMIKS